MTSKRIALVTRMMNDDAAQTRLMIADAIRMNSATYDDLAAKWATMAARWAGCLLDGSLDPDRLRGVDPVETLQHAITHIEENELPTVVNPVVPAHLWTPRENAHFDALNILWNAVDEAHEEAERGRLAQLPVEVAFAIIDAQAEEF